MDIKEKNVLMEQIINAVNTASASTNPVIMIVTVLTADEGVLCPIRFTGEFYGASEDIKSKMAIELLKGHIQYLEAVNAEEDYINPTIN